MENPVAVKVLTSIQELEHDALDGCWWNSMPCWLCVVMNDLKEIMLGVFKHHKDTLVFKDDLD